MAVVAFLVEVVTTGPTPHGVEKRAMADAIADAVRREPRMPEDVEPVSVAVTTTGYTALLPVKRDIIRDMA